MDLHFLSDSKESNDKKHNNEHNIKQCLLKNTINDIIHKRNRKAFMLIKLIKLRYLLKLLENENIRYYEEILDIVNLVLRDIQEELKDYNTDMIIKISAFAEDYGLKNILKILDYLNDKAPDLNILNLFENLDRIDLDDFYEEERKNLEDDIVCVYDDINYINDISEELPF